MAAAGLLAAALLTGCTVGPDYQPPAPPAIGLGGARQLADRTADRPAPPLDRWWTGFNDPELNRIITRVLAQNLDIQAAFERAAAARAAATAAGARQLPTFDATAQALAERQSLDSPVGALGNATVPGFQRNAALYDLDAGASWEIDLFGGLRRGEEAAEAEAMAAEADQLGARVTAAAEAADAYLQIRGDQARLDVAERQVATDDELLDLVKLRKAKGMATDREVAQSEALLAQAKGTLPLLRIALTAQMNRLDVLTGTPPDTYAAELAAPAAQPTPPQLSADASELLRRRPDIIAAERRLAAANARIGVAVADYYPKLSLSGLLGFESLDPVRLFRQTTFQPVVTGGLRWRLFDFGQVDAEVDQADAATRQALLAYRRTVLVAAEDVEDACTELVQLEVHGRQVAEQIAALTRARDESQEAYRAGYIALTDALDADRQLLIAEDDLPRTRADTARAAVRLFRALGGGW